MPVIALQYVLQVNNIMAKKKRKKIEYNSFSFRLHEETYKLLKEKRMKSGKSWNLFIYNLLENNKI